MEKSLSLAVTLAGRQTIGKDLVLCAGGAAVTAMAAQVSIPWQPVPFTFQTLAVALCGLSLGARRGAASQAAYLLAGAAGLPVFAEGKFGLVPLLGPTGGYLWAFVAVAWILGRFADLGWDRKPLRLAAGMLIANVVLFGLGALWLSRFVGDEQAFALGVAPFLVSESIKDGIAVLALPSVWWLVGRRSGA